MGFRISIDLIILNFWDLVLSYSYGSSTVLETNKGNIMAYTQSLTRTASWVVVSKADNKPVFETYSKSVVDKINTDKYTVMPVLQWLQSLNVKN
jgi:hypothetical protein